MSHNLCETLKVSRELEFTKSGVNIGQIGRISGHGDEYERKGKSSKLEKWSHDSKKQTNKNPNSFCLYSVSCQQRSGLEDPTEVVCFKC